MAGEPGSLRDQIERLLADALRSDLEHLDAMAVARKLHATELLAMADVADLDTTKLRDALAEVETLKHALATRDTIGQAKGVLVATLGCSPDKAFGLLVHQSQHENRKVSEIASEIVERARSAHG
jgi:AmiR/NasT family two-component response regulator